MKVSVYSWYGNLSLIAPHAQGEVVEADPWVLAKEFFDRGLSVSLRPASQWKNKKKPAEDDGIDVLLCVSDAGWGQR